ncbi:MAG: exosortase-associated protein EpsI, B-type [bacterium]
MKIVPLSLVLACLMALASVAGIAARPSQKADAKGGPVFSLEQTIPKQFGDWRELQQESAQVVNPQTQELLDKLYSQVLTRTYVNSKGYRIMLSLAYGDDQRGGLTAHRPEVCYPAQGFALLGTTETTITTPFGPIAARRLNTRLGARKEPVTYWFNVGDTTVRSQWQQRIVEMRLGFLGQIPDGLLFRVSSIDDTPTRAYETQDAFVNDLLNSVNTEDRMRLAGLQRAKTGAS